MMGSNHSGCSHCGCAPCKNTCACAESPRKWLSRQRVKIDGRAPALALNVSACSVFSTAVPTIYIRRRGQECWLLAYDAMDVDDEGRHVFQFDSKLLTLPFGRYEGQVRMGCEVCGSIELDLTQACRLSINAAAPVAAHDPHIISDKPPGVTNMYEPVMGFKAILCRPLASDDVELPLNSADAAKLCAAAAQVCNTFEVMVFDSIKSEIITVTGCSLGVPIIERGAAGTKPGNFPNGAAVQFSWTEANVVKACSGDCL